MEKSREELQRELDEATAKLEQYQHQQQRLENRLNDYKEIRRRKRNHRLITRGADVESVAPEVRGMSQTALSNKIELSNQLGMPPGFRYAGRKFCLLNSGFDVEIDSVTYHLTSEFSGRGEMGAVINMIELERNRKSLT